MRDDCFFAQLIALEAGRDAPFAHHQHPVGEPEDLRQLRRDHDDPATFRGQRLDQVVDLGLGADVDAARRLVEEQDLRARHDPAADDRLLLVAAAEVADRPVDRERPEVEALHHLLRLVAQRALADHAGGREAPERRQADVACDRAARNDAVALALLGQEADPGLDRGAHVAGRERQAIHDDVAGTRPIDAREEAQQLGATSADQARDAEDLAAVQVEAGVDHMLAARQVARREHDVFGSMRAVHGGGERAADHPGDDRRLADLGQIEHVDELAVAQDRRAPAEPEHLVHLVRDVDDRHALARQLLDQEDEAIELSSASGSTSARPWR